MDRFVRDLMNQPAIDADEERALARRARCGDPEARDDLITAGLRSVVLRATMLGLRGEDLRDAVQSGAVGLIRAVDRFDPERGARLSTYAWRWIGAEMTRVDRREVPLDDVDVPCHDPDREAEHDDLNLLDGLPDDEVAVLRLRFGLAGPGLAPMSRRTVGERLGLSVSQVRTIEAKAMRQVHRRLAKVGDRAPLQGGADPP